MFSNSLGLNNSYEKSVQYNNIISISKYALNNFFSLGSWILYIVINWAHRVYFWLYGHVTGRLHDRGNHLKLVVGSNSLLSSRAVML